MSKLKIIKPIADELGKFAETASSQVTGSDKSSEEETKEVVKHLYGADERKPASTEIAEKSTEETQKLAKLRQELHDRTYFKDILNPPKPPEEKPTERVERQEMEDLQKKTEKDREKEKKRAGIIRVQQRVEKHPGASG